MSHSTEIINAKIAYAQLGIEDHGIMTYMIGLEWGGSGQGFGGYSLDGYDKENKCRKGHPDSILVIRRILEVVDVKDWKDLTGKYVRVRREEGWNGKIQAIGHIINNTWFEPHTYFKDVK